ncbi:hypothetical protein EMCRGX_G017627 [Ephydatia muelleri]
MNANILILTFDESVNVSSLSIGGLTFSSSRGSSAQNWTLNGGNGSLYSNSPSLNQPVITINLGYIDSNWIKTLYPLATSNMTTYLSVVFGSVLDMAGNPVVGIRSLQVTAYWADVTPPQLVAFDLNINTGLLALQFSETVNASSLVVSKLVLQSNQSYAVPFLAVSNSSVARLLQICRVTLVAPISNTSALHVRNLTVDTNPPSLGSFNLDMNVGIITLYFNETVRVSTLNPATLMLSQYAYYASPNATPYSSVQSYTLTGGMVQVPVSDMSGNAVVPLVNGSGLAVSNFTPDTTAPDISFYLLDMNMGQIVLTFTESVDAATLVIPNRVGRNATRPANAFIADTTNPQLLSFDFDLNRGTLHLRFSESISGPSLLPLGPGYPPEVTIVLLDADLNKIKQLKWLAVSNVSTLLSITALAANDTFQNPIVPILQQNATPVSLWTPDTTSPVLLSFAFDENTGVLMLTFDETVPISSFNATTVTLTNLNGINYTLQSQPPLQGAALSPNDSIIITLNLSTVDLNALKILPPLVTSVNNTYILLQANTVTDMSNNLLNTSNLPLRVSAYTKDFTSPRLVAFDINVNNATLTLYFSESVNVSSFSVSQITLQVASNLTVSSYQLMANQPPYPQGTVTNSPNGPVVNAPFGNLGYEHH